MSRIEKMPGIKKTMQVAGFATQIIAVLVCITLIVASMLLMWESGVALMNSQIDVALQDALFVLILLEMFYVIRSFIRHGSINASIVLNIAVIAAVKELIFQMKSINLEIAASFGLIFVSLGILYFAEIFSFEKKQT